MMFEALKERELEEQELEERELSVAGGRKAAGG